MIFLSIIIGFIIGWLALKLLINYRLKRMLESIINSPLPEKKEAKKVDIDLVKIKDVIYAYSREEQEFLAQGITKEEIVANLKKRFPDTSFMASPKNLREVGLDESI
jgi:hypothetical protein